MKKPIFTGVATALVTPFRDGAIDLNALEHLLLRQAEAGTPAVVLCGTTGEAPTLQRQEKMQLVRFARTVLGERMKIIVGVGTNSTPTSVQNAVDAAQWGADALLAVTPYYNKGTQAGLVAHYRALADATDLPLLLYNVPGRTGVNLSPESCKHLALHPRINGLKEASGNLSQAARVLSCCEPDFFLWSGNDDQTVALMALGAKGVISVLSNLCPETMQRMTTATLAGDFNTAAAVQLQYQPLADALFCETNPVPVKYALSVLGVCKNELRLPLTPLHTGGRMQVRAAMEQCMGI